MRWLIIFSMLLVSFSAEAATMRCRGFAFGYADLICETVEPALRAAAFCEVMNRQGGSFRWSRNDTDATKDRADLINAAGKKLCGWRGRAGK